MTDTTQRYGADAMRLALWGLAIAALQALSRGARLWCHYLWSGSSAEIGHAWIMIPFAVYLLWRDRKQIMGNFGPPCWRGLFHLGAWGALLALGEVMGSPLASVVAVLGLACSLASVLAGDKVALQLRFPLALLFFALPLPFFDFLAPTLQLLSATLAEPLIRATGVGIVRDGIMIQSGEAGRFMLRISAECSGLRTLFSLLALTVVYAHITLPRGWRQRLLVLAAIPLALAGNIVRVATIVVVTHHCGMKIGAGIYHDVSGYLAMLGCMLAVAHLGSLLNNCRKRVESYCAKAT